MSAYDRFAEIVQLLVNDPAAAADRMDALADELHKRAALIRQDLPPRSVGSIGDRVTINVVRRTGNGEQA